MRANVLEIHIFCGILVICSSITSDETCRRRCGATLEGCSCQPACPPNNQNQDFNQSCLQVTPHSSSMLGGRPLKILGLDLHLNQRLLCRFKGEIDTEGFVDADGRGHCVSPLLYETGWIPFDVSIDGVLANRSGEYLAVHPSRADPSLGVRLINATQWENYMAGPLTMTWSSSLIGAEGVNVELWGYRETAGGAEGSSPRRAELSYLYSLGRGVPNTGVFTFSPETSQDSEWQLGNIRITADSTSDGARDVEGLWSRGHILAWQLPQAFRDESAAWAHSKCLQWEEMEKTLPNFLEDLSDCPCTLAQARADTGRFHTDYSCNMDTGSVCTYHPGSVHCVRAIQASPTHGSGQQCCYDSTGALVLTGDSAGGSTPDRAHDWGSPPYREPPRVPGYSHWLYDVMSFYYCCLWSDHCHIYLRQRPSSGCRNYRPPRAGAVLGDAHFITIDGLSYAFGGKGEYYLLSSPDTELSVQARTEEVKLKNGTSAKATRPTSVAMKEKASDVIEVRVADGNLQVLRNHRTLTFTEQRWMDLHGAFVFAPGPHNVTVMLSSGAAVEVRLYEGNMATTVLLPPEFQNRTGGLLGLMCSQDPSDGSSAQSSEMLPSANMTAEQMFTFGARCNISKADSLFTYDSDYLLRTYYFPPTHDPAFIPDFSRPERPDDPLVADMLCVCLGEGAQLCKFDTLTTRSLAIGNATLRAYQDHQGIVKALEPVVSCGWLPTPKEGVKSGARYLQGDTLGFSCNEGYALYGSARRTCLGDGSWSGEKTHCVTDNITGFILGAAGALSALVTMGVMVQLHTKKQRRERQVDQTQEQTC